MKNQPDNMQMPHYWEDTEAIIQATVDAMQAAINNWEGNEIGDFMSRISILDVSLSILMYVLPAVIEPTDISDQDGIWVDVEVSRGFADLMNYGRLSAIAGIQARLDFALDTFNRLQEEED